MNRANRMRSYAAPRAASCDQEIEKDAQESLSVHEKGMVSSLFGKQNDCHNRYSQWREPCEIGRRSRHTQKHSSL